MLEWSYIASCTVFVLCAIEAIAILALFGQIGNIYLILDEVPKLAHTPEGVVVAGKPVPAVDVRLCTGESANLRELAGGGALILFVQESCLACREAIHLVGTYLEEYSQKLRVLIVVNDSVDGSRRFATSIPFPCTLIADADGQVSAAFHEPTPPYICVTDSEAIIRGQGKLISQAHLEHIVSPITGIHVGQLAVVGSDTRLSNSIVSRGDA